MGKSSDDSDKKKKEAIGQVAEQPKEKKKEKSHKKKGDSDEGVKAAKAGLCACGICCALCIGIPLCIIIIIIIIIVVAVGSAEDDINTWSDGLRGCNTVEREFGACDTAFDCKGDRYCGIVQRCEGSANC